MNMSSVASQKVPAAGVSRLVFERRAPASASPRSGSKRIEHEQSERRSTPWFSLHHTWAAGATLRRLNGLQGGGY